MHLSHSPTHIVFLVLLNLTSSIQYLISYLLLCQVLFNIEIMYPSWAFLSIAFRSFALILYTLWYDLERSMDVCVRVLVIIYSLSCLPIAISVCIKNRSIFEMFFYSLGLITLIVLNCLLGEICIDQLIVWYLDQR